MPSYTLYELLIAYQTPLLPQEGFGPLFDHQPILSTQQRPQLRRKELNDEIGRFKATVRYSFFPRIQYEEHDRAGR